MNIIILLMLKLQIEISVLTNSDTFEGLTMLFQMQHV